MDLSKLVIDPENQTADLEILHPKTFAPLTDEKGDNVVITLHGPDSSAQKAVIRKFQNKAMKEGIKRRRLNLSQEQLEAKALAIDVAATKSWENVGFDGEELECNPANVKLIYTKLPWIREQVEEFINERSNFLGE